MTEDKSQPSGKYVDCPPEFITDVAHLDILNELIQREPIFHHPEFGTTRQDFETQVDPTYWETGASGRRYHREFVLTEVVKRYEDSQYRGIHSPPENTWQTKDFYCQEIAHDHYLLTYTLVQEERVTRRLTLWRHSNTGWKILYHQGTMVEDTQTSLALLG